MLHLFVVGKVWWRYNDITSSNRDHMSWSLYYCLGRPLLYTFWGILSLYLWFVFSLSGDSLAYGIASFSGNFHMWWYVYHYNLKNDGMRHNEIEWCWSHCGSSLLKRKNSTRLGQLRESTGDFNRSVQGTPKLTIKKLRPACFARPAQFITIGLYSLMVLFW